jgi:hypothetical protein
MKTPSPALVFSTVATVVTLCAVVASSGCFLREKKEMPAPGPASAFKVRPAGNTNVVLTPATSRTGRVASVNKQANIVIVSFPVGQLPANNTRLSIFHGGMKTGEVNITGPAVENLSAGDIVSGSAQEGDEVRAE